MVPFERLVVVCPTSRKCLMIPPFHPQLEPLEVLEVKRVTPKIVSGRTKIVSGQTNGKRPHREVSLWQHMSLMMYPIPPRLQPLQPRVPMVQVSEIGRQDDFTFNSKTFNHLTRSRDDITYNSKTFNHPVT